MSVPRVYAAITGIISDLSREGIAKRQTNQQEHYPYRGIDDILNHLSPLLAQHRLCILPRILKRSVGERRDGQGNLLITVALKAAFDLVCAEDGSIHVVESFGEALDSGDKATSKAMTSAFKNAVIQTFCIPVGSLDDADAHSHQLKAHDQNIEPVQGWVRWAADIVEIVASCQTGEAIDRLQDTNRGLLRAAALFDAKLYAAIGESIRARRAALTQARPAAAPCPKVERPKAVRTRSRAPAAAHA